METSRSRDFLQEDVRKMIVDSHISQEDKEEFLSLLEQGESPRVVAGVFFACVNDIAQELRDTDPYSGLSSEQKKRWNALMAGFDGWKRELDEQLERRLSEIDELDITTRAKVFVEYNMKMEKLLGERDKSLLQELVLVEYELGQQKVKV